MNLSLLQTEPARSLGWALIEFLWQGAAVAVLVKLTLAALARSSGQARYLVACGGLVALFACPLVTLLVLSHPPGLPTSHVVAEALTRGAADDHPVPLGEANQVVRITSQRQSNVAGVSGWVEARLPWVLLVWSAGVFMLSVRLAGGWWQVRWLTERSLPLDEVAWQERLASAVERLGVTRPVKLVRSAFVQVPTAIGWLRPGVLLPMSSLTGLAPAELEALLAHELAHVYRQDYLVNLLQSALETLLFYHPAVWWISGQIRIEREHACDDLVVAAYADRLTYARALANLEERCSTEQFALSANGGSLVQRIRRLVGPPAENRTSAGWMIGMAVPAGLACLLLALRSAPEVQATSRHDDQPNAIAGTASAAPNPDIVEQPGPAEGQKLLPDNPETAAAGENHSAPSDASQLLTRTDNVNPNFDPGAAPPELGLPNPPQKTLLFDEQAGVPLVRGTVEEHERVEKAAEVGGVALPQVMIQIRFTELGEREIKKLGLTPPRFGAQAGPNASPISIQVTNRTGHVSPPGRDETVKGIGQLFDNPGLRNVEQVSPGTAWTINAERFRAVLLGLERKGGADLLPTPRLTTLSGRQARIEVIELKNIVTGVSIATDAHNNSSATFIPTALPTGPAVDVLPQVAADGKTIRLRVAPCWTEFLGYDEPGPFVPQGTFDGNRLSPPLKVQRPLPAFHAVQTMADISVRDGETIVITGLGSLHGQPKTPERGRSFKTAAGSGRQLVVFVSPVVVDSAGPRVPRQ